MGSAVIGPTSPISMRSRWSRRRHDARGEPTKKLGSPSIAPYCARRGIARRLSRPADRRFECVSLPLVSWCTHISDALVCVAYLVVFARSPSLSILVPENFISRFAAPLLTAAALEDSRREHVRIIHRILALKREWNFPGWAPSSENSAK